jgi:predicted MFS family arabinose efflux permease
MYLAVSFIGAEVLEKMAEKLHVKTMDLGWVATIMFLPILFPVVATALLLTAIANVFRRKRHEDA